MTFDAKVSTSDIGKIVAVDEFDAVVMRPRAGLSPLERKVRAARGALKQQNDVVIKMGDACDRLTQRLEHAAKALEIFQEAAAVLNAELHEARKAAKAAKDKAANLGA